MHARHLGVVLLLALGACSSSVDGSAELLADARKSRAVLQSLLTIDAAQPRWQGATPGTEPCPVAIDETTRALVSNLTSALQSRVGDLDRLIAKPGELSTTMRLQDARKVLATARVPVVVFVRQKKEAPKATKEGFTPGRLGGSLVVFDIATDRAVCAAMVDVTNKSSVEVMISEQEAKLDLSARDLVSNTRLENILEADLLNELAKASTRAVFQRVP